MHLCILDLEASRRQDQCDKGGREEHFENGNVAGFPGLVAFCKGIGGENAKSSGSA